MGEGHERDSVMRPDLAPLGPGGADDAGEN